MNLRCSGSFEDEQADRHVHRHRKRAQLSQRLAPNLWNAVRCRLDRPFRNIDAGEPESASLRARRRQPAEVLEVVTLPATGIDDIERNTLHRFQAVANRIEDEIGNRFEMAGIEKSPPRCNHVLAVAWITRGLVLDDQKIAIPLSRHVEAMAGRTPALRPVRFDRQPIDRTGEIRGGDDVHCRPRGLAFRSPYSGPSFLLKSS